MQINESFPSDFTVHGVKLVLNSYLSFESIEFCLFIDQVVTQFLDLSLVRR